MIIRFLQKLCIIAAAAFIAFWFAFYHLWVYGSLPSRHETYCYVMDILDMGEEHQG